MKKVKTFADTFIRSLLPQLPHYPRLAAKSFPATIEYLLTLVVVLNILFIGSVCLRFNPKKVEAFVSSLGLSLERFPDDLYITLNKGNLTTTFNRPYFMWMNFGDKKKLIGVVDINATPDKINEYRPFFLLTAKEAVIRPFKKNVTLPLNYFSNQVFDRNKALSFKAQLIQFTRFLPLIYTLTVFLLLVAVPAVSFLVTLLYLAIASLAVLLIFKLLTQELTFLKIFKVSFYAVTLPLVLDYGLIIFRIKMTPLMFLLLLIIFLFCGVYEAHLDKEKRRSVAAHSH